MKLRFFLFTLAALFVCGGFLSLFGSEAKSPISSETSAAPPTSLVSPTVQTATVPYHIFVHSLSRNRHLMILVRMGLFYGGFICILLAFDFGTDSEEQPQSSGA